MEGHGRGTMALKWACTCRKKSDKTKEQSQIFLNYLEHRTSTGWCVKWGSTLAYRSPSIALQWNNGDREAQTGGFAYRAQQGQRQALQQHPQCISRQHLNSSSAAEKTQGSVKWQEKVSSNCYGLNLFLYCVSKLGIVAFWGQNKQ